MKKLLILAIAGVLSLSTVSCSNDDFTTNDSEAPTASQKNTYAKGDVEMWEKPSDYAYALDGYIHIVVGENPLFVYMGEELKPDESEAGLEVINLITNGETNRRTAYVYCKVNYDGYSASLVEVSGNGQPRTYFIVFTNGDGSMVAIQNPKPSYNQCSAMHFQAWIGNDYGSRK